MPVGTTAYDRGTLVIPNIGQLGPSQLVINKEDITIQAGLVHKNAPLLSSQNAFQAAIWGRGREIVLSGLFKGPQANFEQNFLFIIEGWVNETFSLQITAQYYPLNHSLNTNNAGKQTGYYNVMCDTFKYTFDENEPTLIRFTLVLREGTKLGPLNILAGGS